MDDAPVEAAAAPDGDSIQLRLEFVGTDRIPVVFANQFVVQRQRDEYILTIAQFAQPILLGSLDEKKAQARQLPDSWPVQVVGRFGLTATRLDELIAILTETRDRAAQDAPE